MKRLCRPTVFSNAPPLFVAPAHHSHLWGAQPLHPSLLRITAGRRFFSLTSTREDSTSGSASNRPRRRRSNRRWRTERTRHDETSDETKPRQTRMAAIPPSSPSAPVTPIVNEESEGFFERYFNAREDRLDDPLELERAEEALALEEEQDESEASCSPKPVDTHPRRRGRSRTKLPATGTVDNQLIPKMGLGKVRDALEIECAKFKSQKHETRNSGLWDSLFLRIEEIVLSSSSNPKSAAPGVVHYATALLSILKSASSLQLPYTTPLIHVVRAVTQHHQHLSPKQIADLLDSLSKLRYRDRSTSLILESMALNWPSLPSVHLITALNAMASLDWPVEDASVLPLTLAVKNRLQLRLLMARSLCSISATSVMTLFDSDMVSSYLSNCFELSMMSTGTSPFNGFKGRQLHMVELFIRLCRPELYEGVPPPVKQFLQNNRRAADAPLAHSDKNGHQHGKAEASPIEVENGCHIHPVPRDMVIRDVKAILEEDIGMKNILMNVHAGPLRVDLFSPEARAIIRIRSDLDFYLGTSLMTMDTRCCDRLFDKMGFNVTDVSLKHFLGLSTPGEKWGYVLRK